MIDEKILAELKKYPGITKNTLCLECGYDGRMGIKSYKKFSKTLSRVTVVIGGVVIVIGAMARWDLTKLMIVGGIIGVIIGIFDIKIPHILVCPNCSKELEKKKINLRRFRLLKIVSSGVL